MARHLSVFAIAAVAWLMGTPTTGAPEAGPPNILLVVTDDQPH